MERVIQIGIYDYINEQFPLSKENKVMYYRILMKRPQFLHAHIEWLYNNPNVFLGDMFTRMKLWGLNEYMNTYYRSLSPEMFQNQYEMYERIIKFNDEQDYEYAKTKYRTDIGLCRSNSGNTPLTERIRLSGLYAYLETYGGLTTGIKLQKYYTMITDPELFESHCQSLLQAHTLKDDIFPLYNISSVIT